MTKRIKAKSIATRAEFEETVDELVRATVELRQLEAIRDQRIQEARDEFAPGCEALAEQINGMVLSAENYAIGHRDELIPKDAKSAETTLATYGFRLGNKTLKLLNKKWTWDMVVGALKRTGRRDLVRTTEDADKEGIKAEEFSDEKMKALGVRVTQSETFFVDPKDRAAEAQ